VPRSEAHTRLNWDSGSNSSCDSQPRGCGHSLASPTFFADRKSNVVYVNFVGVGCRIKSTSLEGCGPSESVVGVDQQAFHLTSHL
jgi:hypothetical protein